MREVYTSICESEKRYYNIVYRRMKIIFKVLQWAYHLVCSRLYTFECMYLIVCQDYRFVQIAEIHNWDFAYMLSDTL